MEKLELQSALEEAEVSLALPAPLPRTLSYPLPLVSDSPLSFTPGGDTDPKTKFVSSFFSVYPLTHDCLQSQGLHQGKHHSLVTGQKVVFPTMFIKLKYGHRNNPSDSRWECGLQTHTDLRMKLGFRTSTLSLGKFLNLFLFLMELIVHTHKILCMIVTKIK